MKKRENQEKQKWQGEWYDLIRTVAEGKSQLAAGMLEGFDEWVAENGRKTRRHYTVAFVAVTLMGMLVLSTVLPQRYSNARTNQLTVAEAGLRVETILGTINNSKV